MIKAVLPKRTTDRWGSGAFGASRGERIHNGIDYRVLPGSQILSPVKGEVTKLGYCYGDDLKYRYVEVTDKDGLQHRIFYIRPTDIEVGMIVGEGAVIGIAQNLGPRYPDITPHVHYEVKDKEGRFLNPEEL